MQSHGEDASTNFYRQERRSESADVAEFLADSSEEDGYPATMYEEVLKTLPKNLYTKVLKRKSSKNGGPKMYKCNYWGCGKDFDQRCNMLRHVIQHYGVKMFKCSNCNQPFSQRSNMKKHETACLQKAQATQKN